MVRSLILAVCMTVLMSAFIQNSEAANRPSPAALGGFVWEDLNGDGIQDAGEPGVEGFTVNLLDCQGKLLFSIITDHNGSYLFENLAPGCYLCGFAAHEGLVCASKDQGGDDEVVSDANSVTGQSVPVILGAGEENLSVDAGLSSSCFAGEGCGIGYWKQHQHLRSWAAPYGPNTLFSDVFDDAFSSMTLLDVLWQRGRGLRALGRHTVAALLNAASQDVDYALSVADVVSLFDEVFPGRSWDYVGLINLFADLNRRVCPLEGVVPGEPPEPLPYSCPTVHPGEPHTIYGDGTFGTKRGRVYLMNEDGKRRGCRVRRELWNPFNVTCIVPKRLSGRWNVFVKPRGRAPSLVECVFVEPEN